MMKIIVAGSRNVTLRQHVEYCINRGLQVLGHNTPVGYEIVSGGAHGPDFLAEQWAKKHGKPFTLFKADWDTHGKKAGILRNIDMGNYADALIAIWDGKSKGTKHMIDYMYKLNKPIVVYPGE